MRKPNKSRYINFWVVVALPTLGFCVNSAISLSQACSSKPDGRLIAMQRLVAAEAKVDTMLLKQARMEHLIQQCVDRGTDHGVCWSGEYDFDFEAALAAWSEFDSALLAARPYAGGAREVQAIQRLDALFKYYRNELAVQVADERHDARETAARIRKTAQDLGVALDDLKRI